MTIEWSLILPPLRHIMGRYVAASWWLLALVAGVVLLSSATAVAAPYVFSRMIDALAAGSAVQVLFWGLLAYAALLGISTALSRTVGFISLMSGESLGYFTATAFFEKLLKKRAQFFIEHNPTEIQSAQGQGVGAFNTLIQLALIGFIPGIVEIVLAIVMLGTVISVEIAAIVFAYGTVFIAVSAWAARQSRPHLDAAIKATQDRAKFVGNAIGGVETLRQFGSDAWLTGRFFDKAREVLGSWQNFSVLQIWFCAALGLALFVQFALTFFVLLPRMEQGALSVGDLVLINALLLQLNSPFQFIGQAIDSLARSYAQMLPFARMWAAEEEPDHEDGDAFAIAEGVLAVEDVSFRYENGRGVDDASFTARRGAITFLTGDTGSGKSTLFRLILKGIEPQSGRITMDGADIADISRQAWFSGIAAVPQDVVLLNDTLGTNIVLGRVFDAERLRRAADRAAILPFIEGLDEGFETVVGERGLKLSGGERQRVAIARALYGDPAMLLLDEASSALDETTEKDIMDHLRTIADRVTIIAITHRLSVIGAGDTVVRLSGDRNG